MVALGLIPFFCCCSMFPWLSTVLSTDWELSTVLCFLSTESINKSKAFEICRYFECVDRCVDSFMLCCRQIPGFVDRIVDSSEVFVDSFVDLFNSFELFVDSCGRFVDIFC